MLELPERLRKFKNKRQENGVRVTPHLPSPLRVLGILLPPGGYNCRSHSTASSQQRPHYTCHRTYECYAPSIHSGDCAAVARPPPLALVHRC
ncbi:hypothetical protein GCM10010270_53380 [Streptomyces violaceus]|nr:hypothetical protein GCM10010270_53380 [Streptomyces janthinus]